MSLAPTWRRQRVLLYSLISFAVALALRLWVNLSYTPTLYSDEISLFQYATNVARGLYYGTRGAYWPPGFIIMAGWAFKVAGVDPAFLSVRILQALLGGASAALLAAWAGRILSPETGLFAGLLFAIHRGLIYYSGRFYSETLFFFLFLATLLLYDRHFESGRTRDLVLGSILLGLSALTRPVSLPLLGILFVWWLLTRRMVWRSLITATVLAGTVTALTIVPWTVRNWVVMHGFVPIDVNGGINFYLAHNPKANGMWVDLEGDPILLPYDQPSVDQEGFAAGLRYIRTHPQRELDLLRVKNRLFWTANDPEVDGNAPARLTLLRQWGVPRLSIGILWRLALLGLPFALVRWRRASPALLFVLYYYLLIMLLTGSRC